MALRSICTWKCLESIRTVFYFMFYEYVLVFGVHVSHSVLQSHQKHVRVPWILKINDKRENIMALCSILWTKITNCVTISLLTRFTNENASSFASEKRKSSKFEQNMVLVTLIICFTTCAKAVLFDFTLVSRCTVAKTTILMGYNLKTTVKKSFKK